MAKAQPDRPLLTEDLPAILEHYAEGFDCAVDPQLECGEFDWFASDRRGRVAVFSVGGLGDVPNTVLADRDRFLAVVACLVQRPWRGEPILATRRTGRYDDWLAYASVGLFGFDCGGRRDQPRSYEVLARPSRPLMLDELPAAVAAELGRIRFSEVEFGQVERLDIAVLGKSRPADPSLSAYYDRN